MRPLAALCESSTLSRCGSTTVCHAPPVTGWRAMAAWRSAVYQAAYWWPL